jgi:hypothetical protein
MAWTGLLAHFMLLIHGKTLESRYMLVKKFILEDFFLPIAYALLIWSAYLH